MLMLSKGNCHPHNTFVLSESRLPFRCAFCHGTEVDDEDGGGRQKQGLGQFTLVRVSAIQYAWVHPQCAWWSPEVRPLSVLLCHTLGC